MTKHPLAVGFLVVAGGTSLAQPPAVTAPAVLPAPSALSCTPPAHPAGPGCGLTTRRLTFQGTDGVPFGMAVAAHFGGHIQAGEVARMVFHDYDFQPDSSKLNHRGWERAVEVAKLMSANDAPVVVERLPREPRLAEERRLAVLTALTAIAPSISPSRVVVATPVAQPLSGTDALIIHQTATRLTTSAGYLPMNGSGGSSTGGGFSSSGGGQPGGNPTTPTNR